MPVISAPTPRTSFTILSAPICKANNGTGRTPFTGNIIPANRINPISAKIFALMQPTNEPFAPLVQTNNYFALLPFTKTTDHVDGKGDYQANDKDRFAVRFSFEKPVIYQASMYGDAGGPAQGAFQGTGVQRTYSTGLNWDRVVSPTLITQTRIGVAYYNNVAKQTDYGKNRLRGSRHSRRQYQRFHQRHGVHQLR